MKKLTKIVTMIVVISLMLTMPAYAQSTAEPRGSAFFGSYGTDLYKTSSTSFQIWFDVVSNVTTMDVLGVSEIILYRSSDGETWSKVKLYTMDVYAQMVDYDTSSHTGYVSYNFATTGRYYRAYITFYAKNSKGIGERYVYTEILKM